MPRPRSSCPLGPAPVVRSPTSARPRDESTTVLDDVFGAPDDAGAGPLDAVLLLAGAAAVVAGLTSLVPTWVLAAGSLRSPRGDPAPAHVLAAGRDGPPGCPAARAVGDGSLLRTTTPASPGPVPPTTDASATPPASSRGGGSRSTPSPMPRCWRSRRCSTAVPPCSHRRWPTSPPARRRWSTWPTPSPIRPLVRLRPPGPVLARARAPRRRLGCRRRRGARAGPARSWMTPGRLSGRRSGSGSGVEAAPRRSRECDITRSGRVRAPRSPVRGVGIRCRGRC